MGNSELSLEEKAEIWRGNPQIPGLQRTIENNQDIFLVAARVKPASFVYLSPDNMPPHIPPLFYTLNMEPYLEHLGISYTIQPKGDVTTLFVAKTVEERERLFNAYNQRKHPHALGLALGYPKTAVWANASGKILSEEKSKIVRQEVGIFVEYQGFFLSESYWQEEIKVLKHWHDLLDKYGFMIREVPTTE